MSGEPRGELFARRLIAAAASGDPFSFATICYLSLRESPLLNKYKNNGDKEEIEELVKSSIIRNAVILREEMKWEREKVDKFLEYMKDFVKEI